MWPCWCVANTNVIISQLVDSIIEDNLIVNVLNEAFTHRQTQRGNLARGRGDDSISSYTPHNSSWPPRPLLAAASFTYSNC